MRHFLYGMLTGLITIILIIPAIYFIAESEYFQTALILAAMFIVVFNVIERYIKVGK